MAKIHELSENLANQIAAGEVIERPASVVKELIENSIDAGSTRVRIDFIDAGLKQITVQDNGSGIERDQIDLAFTRHATSKINTERDLFNVATLGFRGEALASISAVSHVEILTSSGSEVGTRAKFSGGIKDSQEDAAARKGTQITVQDLFYNTPARLKYLRSPRTEIMKIVDIVNRIALGYPQIAITLTNSGKVLLRTPGNKNLQQTIANVYGRHIAEKMVPFKKKDRDFEISGLLSKPDLTRSTRNFISILLNGRYIKNYQLAASVMDGYGAKLTTRHYPIAIVNIKVDPLLVDVNVHPTKQEVRLSKEKELSRLITSAISTTFIQKVEETNAFDNVTINRKNTLVDQLKFNLNKNVVNTKRKSEVHENRPTKIIKRTPRYVDLNQVREDSRYILTKTWNENVQKQTQLTPFPEEKNTEIISDGDEILNNNLPQLNYIGQNQSYMIADNDGDLYLVDQLAARRRLMYDKLRKQIDSDKKIQQTLLTPIILEFSNFDFLQIKAKASELNKIGIALEDFGQDSFIVRSYPTWISGDIEKSIRKILDNYLNYAKGDFTKFLNQIALLESKKQVKTRKKISDAEARRILSSLRTVSEPYHDEEGNLVIVKMPARDLEKMFKKDK
ncbi:DNA mismatch repair endonuclease MutL [Lactobacillus sp. LL6]|uniref:DNA mismatch repair endonuclease MutL n=1 Tax=Lactobacillus sp. LL6 TaxID=2596827 RepID=UPI00118678C8|nr:DNA mismatch repair endonuclease MutL [Lactobacillus sp. LL6]TSO25927.1 DNA mismatch repair endonuclease MutL [Lactobacillus sp. LL6]